LRRQGDSNDSVNAGAFCKLAILAISGILLCACGSRVNLDNYNKLKTGQSYSEVKAILGEATNCDEMLAFASVSGATRNVASTVNLVSDKVLLLSAHNLN